MHRLGGEHNLSGGVMRLMQLQVIAVLLLFSGCGQSEGFQGSSDTRIRKKTVDSTSDGSSMTPSTAEPLKNDLGDDDLQTLKGCQQKDSSLLTGATIVEVKDLASSILSKGGFEDSYHGKEKRIVILNITSEVVNKLSLRLTNASTTYCLNVTAKIVNKMNVGLVNGAKLIEATNLSISNKISTYKI